MRINRSEQDSHGAQQRMQAADISWSDGSGDTLSGLTLGFGDSMFSGIPSAILGVYSIAFPGVCHMNARLQLQDEPAFLLSWRP